MAAEPELVLIYLQLGGTRGPGPAEGKDLREASYRITKPTR